MNRSRLFRVFTIVLLFACVWTVFANVLSDDADVRARAGEVARKFAGCGEKCRVTGMNGERGMLAEEISYDIDGAGKILVTCRRAFVIAGDYGCDAAKR